MNEGVRVAVVQPPVPEGNGDDARYVQKGLALAHQAIESGANIICLPEYFGVFGLPARKCAAEYSMVMES